MRFSSSFSNKTYSSSSAVGSIWTGWKSYLFPVDSCRVYLEALRTRIKQRTAAMVLCMSLAIATILQPIYASSNVLGVQLQSCHTFWAKVIIIMRCCCFLVFRSKHRLLFLGFHRTRLAVERCFSNIADSSLLKTLLCYHALVFPLSRSLSISLFFSFFYLTQRQLSSTKERAPFVKLN